VALEGFCVSVVKQLCTGWYRYHLWKNCFPIQHYSIGFNQSLF